MILKFGARMTKYNTGRHMIIIPDREFKPEFVSIERRGDHSFKQKIYIQLSQIMAGTNFISTKSYYMYC